MLLLAVVGLFEYCKMAYNDNEIGMLKAIASNAQDAAGGDFALSDELYIYIPELSKSQIKGYLSALEKKGVIFLDSVKVDSNIVHQITFEKRLLEILIENRMLTVIEAEDYDAWHRD